MPTLLETAELLDELSRHIHHIKDTLRADDQRLRNPLHRFERAQKQAIELPSLHMTIPQRSPVVANSITQSSVKTLSITLICVLNSSSVNGLQQHLFSMNVG